MAFIDERQGKITRLFKEKKFGFIRDDQDSRDRFFHISGLEQTTKSFEELREGDRVAFMDIEGEKGPRAVGVRVIA